MLGPRLVDARGMSGCRRGLEVAAAAGDLVRYVALGRGRTSLSLPTHSRPRNPREYSKRTGRPGKSQDETLSCMGAPALGLGHREFSLEGAGNFHLLSLSSFLFCSSETIFK